jgi:hypothetical protein
MLKIIVSLLAPTDNEKMLRELHQEIVAAAAGIAGLKINGEDDLLVLFPPDLMRHGIGKELFVEIGQFGAVPRLDTDGQRHLCVAVGHAVKAKRPGAKVRCAIDPQVWRSYDSAGAVEWLSGPPITREEVERLQASLQRHRASADAEASKKCSCEQNSVDHKGTCIYHAALASYDYLLKQADTVLVAEQPDFPVLADTFVATCMKESFCGDFQKEMGWKTE